MAEKRLLLPCGCFLQSKPLLQEGIRRTRSRISCIFLLYAFIFFTQQSAPYAGLVWSSFRRVGTHFPAVRAVYGDVSGEKEGGCEKNFFHFFPSPSGCFPFAVRKTFRRNAFLFHHNSMQRPALCRQNAQPCSHKGNTPGETGR